MAKSNSGRSKAAATPEPQGGSVLTPVMDAMKAHPVATAAAVAVGGAVVAGLARRARGAPPVAEASASAKKNGKPKRAAGSGLTRKVTPDSLLASVVGGEPLTRADITRKIWDYIKAHGLQDTANRRMINADATLRPIFGQEQVSMFEMTRLVSRHVS